MNYTQHARNVIDIELEGIRKVRDSLDDAFGEGIRTLLATIKAGGKVVVTGVGKNLPIGQKIAATLTSTGSPAVFLHPQEALHGDLGIVCAGDAVIALSYSGETEELANLIPLIKRAGVRIVALCGNKESMLARNSDVVIPVTIDREACPFNMAPTASTTAALAVGDALAMVLLEARGFRREDYARLHPGGTIGRALLLRAADIMRANERIAALQPGAPIRDAVLAMTRARSGSLVVVSEDRRVLGIFTDGDLRRHISAGDDINTVCIGDYMTPDPIVVKSDQLAADVLKLYESHNIDDLIVVDDEGKLAGMIDIQDLPKMKIL